mgnify:CR=1 FL=1
MCTCLALSCLSAFFLWVAGHAPSKAVKDLDVQRIQLQNLPEKAFAAFSFFSIRHMRASHHCCDVQCSRFCFLLNTTERDRAMLGCSACLFGTYNNINKSLYLAYTQPHSLRAGKNERFKFYQARRRRGGRPPRMWTMWTGLVSRTARWLALSPATDPNFLSSRT